MEEELKPCPFCGGKAVSERHMHKDFDGAVTCYACEAKIYRECSPRIAGEKQAMDLWNTRPLESKARAEVIEEIRKKIDEYGKGNILKILDELEGCPKMWEIWAEGYETNSEYQGPYKQGEILAASFKEACEKWYKDDSYYNSNTNTYWGMRLYPNETEVMSNSCFKR